MQPWRRQQKQIWQQKQPWKQPWKQFWRQHERVHGPLNESETLIGNEILYDVEFLTFIYI
jgi:hypothetical protein